MTSIEQLWAHLSTAHAEGAQTRVDSDHPHDIYADLQAPNQVGLIIVGETRPPALRAMRAITIEEGQRGDGRWTLKISLTNPQLRPVFTALCRDIVDCTRTNVDDSHIFSTVVHRLLHWRTMLERDPTGLSETTLRGLLGELVVLRDILFPAFTPLEAVHTWQGPFGAPQDFALPDGRRVEVKTTRTHADTLRINGLDQLDAAGEQLSLVVVRTEETSPGLPNALSVPSLIEQIRGMLTAEPETVSTFNAALAAVHWHDHPAHHDVVLRVVRVDSYEVIEGFPKLTRAVVPNGIVDADYLIALPAQPNPTRLPP